MKLIWYFPVLIFYLKLLIGRLNLSNGGLILLIGFSILLQIKILNGKSKDNFNLLLYTFLNTGVLSYILYLVHYKFNLNLIIGVNIFVSVLYLFNTFLKSYKIYIIILILISSTFSCSIKSIYCSDSVNIETIVLFLNSFLFLIYFQKGTMLSFSKN